MLGINGKEDCTELSLRTDESLSPGSLLAEDMPSSTKGSVME